MEVAHSNSATRPVRTCTCAVMLYGHSYATSHLWISTCAVLLYDLIYAYLNGNIMKGLEDHGYIRETQLLSEYIIGIEEYLLSLLCLISLSVSLKVTL